jgi:hypothetical protein
MQPRFLEKRVQIVERTVEGLETLPARVAAVEGQILDLCAEMRSEFSAVRRQIEDTNTHMRVLHENVIERLKVLGEQFNGRGRKRRRR